jgi:hypothetical protein
MAEAILNALVKVIIEIAEILVRAGFAMLKERYCM